MQQLGGSLRHSMTAALLCLGEQFKGLHSVSVHPSFSTEIISALKTYPFPVL